MLEKGQKCILVMTECEYKHGCKGVGEKRSLALLWESVLGLAHFSEGVHGHT